MVDPKKEVPVVFIDDPKAPEIFVTSLTGYWLNQGNAHLTFEAVRVNHETSPRPLNRVVVARLVMPISSAQNLASGLYDFLKQHGLDPVPTPPKDQLQ